MCNAGEKLFCDKVLVDFCRAISPLGDAVATSWVHERQVGAPRQFEARFALALENRRSVTGDEMEIACRMSWNFTMSPLFGTPAGAAMQCEGHIILNRLNQPLWLAVW